MNDLTPIPQNYKNNVNWIMNAYTDSGISFANGFQKDSIQNSVGARKTKKWNNWSCDISFIENEIGKFVVVEDSGTVGLTGRNIPIQEMYKMMAEGVTLQPTERLARFTSMFNSGGNTTGSGLFGAGKSVYSVASEMYTYYFDSLREDGLYVSNVNECGNVKSLAFEGDEAKKFIFDNTGLTPKTTSGTRVIIVSPKAELINSINDGSIIPFIQESWWLIIQRLDGKSKISVNSVPVLVPDNIKNAKHKFELDKPEIYSTNYKVKHFGLYMFDDYSQWQGISYYRKGMKIGEVEIKNVPDKIKGKYWGYIEVDEEWEAELSEIEDRVHFGVSSGKKNKSAYRNLKNYCNSKFEANLIEWGYIKNRENEDKKLKEELNKIAEEVQDLFETLGFEDLGKGPQKSKFDVRWQDIIYPNENSEKVTTGDEIKFSFRIKSTYATDKKFEFKIYVFDPNSGTIVSNIDNKKISIKSNTVYKGDYIHVIETNNSVQHAENKIILSVKVIGSGKEKKKDLAYFYDVDKINRTRELVNLSLHECTFPLKGSRRVNFDESIQKVCYRIENKRNHLLKYKLNISIHNASVLTCPKIVDIDSFTGEINPFDEIITPHIDKITFLRDIYEPHLSSGKLELRARLIANGDDELLEKGDKITSYFFKIFLEIDEKNGKHDAFNVQSVDAPDNFKRSWYVPNTDRTIYLNVGHNAYLNIQDFPDIQYGYLREQMLRQYVLLYLAEGKYDMFGDGGTDFTDLDPLDAIDKVLDKVEDVYYRSLM